MKKANNADGMLRHSNRVISLFRAFFAAAANLFAIPRAMG